MPNLNWMCGFFRSKEQKAAILLTRRKKKAEAAAEARKDPIYHEAILESERRSYLKRKGVANT